MIPILVVGEQWAYAMQVASFHYREMGNPQQWRGLWLVACLAVGCFWLSAFGLPSSFGHLSPSANATFIINSTLFRSVEVHARMCHVWMRSIDVTILWPQKCVLRRWMAGSNGCVIATVTFTVDVMVTADFWCNWCYQGYMTTYPLHINCLCCVFTHFS